MVSLLTFKFPLLGFLLMVAYSSMVIDIIGIKKQREGSGNIPSAVVAMLVAAILQMLHTVYLVATSGKGVVGKGTNVIAGTAFFFLFQVGSVAAATAFYVKRDANYCPVDSLIPECPGVSKGVMGLGWSLAGLSLVYIIYVFIICSKYSSLSSELYQTPPKKLANADLDAKREAGGH